MIEDDQDWVFTRPGASVFSAWLAWREKGIYPTAGGWLDQPLSLMIHFDAFEFVVRLFSKVRNPEYGWTQLNPTERAALAEFFR